MEGQFSFPIKYGYSLVGELPDGQLAHLLHPHQDYCLIHPEHAFQIPSTVPAKRATLASNMETALNAIWDGNVQSGDNVLVVGFGLVGSLVARLAQMIPATNVVVADTSPDKLELAKALGFNAAHPGEIKGNYDLAFNTSASGAGLQVAVNQVGFEGRVIELSWYGVRNTVLELGGSFHVERKQIISSQVSNLPPEKRGRWDYKRRKQVAFKLLEDPIFDKHITEEVPFGELPAFFEELRFGKKNPLGAVVKY